mmetsp:Transcript_8637/g.27096  ORF Transcript_8637/g.27096 Transcript_8637/m.27096 type:complete len:1102 (-) Transcript_8637:19-3324(-)
MRGTKLGGEEWAGCAGIVTRGVGRLRDDGGLVAAGEFLELGELHGDLDEGVDDLRDMFVEDGGVVLLDVESDGSAGAGGAREAEDDARAVSHEEADALVLRDGSVDGVDIAEDVGGGDGVGADGLARVLGGHGGHRSHHFCRLGLVDALVVVAAVVVAAVRGPVLLDDLLDGDERGLGRLVVVGEDAEPGEDGEEAVLLADVVRARPERLLAAEQGGVVDALEERLGVHEVSEELPPGRRLEEREVELGGDEVDGAAGGHAPRDGFDAALGLEEGNGVGVGGEDGERVGGRDEELGAEDHVAIAVAVRGGAEGGDVGGVGDGPAGAVDGHLLGEVDGVGEVGVSVVAAEVGEGVGVHAARLGEAELGDEEGFGVWTGDAVHGVEDHGEVGPGEEGLDDVEVEDGLEEVDVRLDAVDDLDGDDGRAVLGLDPGLAELGDVDVGEGFAHVDRGDGLRVGVDEVGELLGRGAAVLAVVLDAKVLVGPARVVGGGEEEGAKGLLPDGALLADDGRERGRAGDAVLGDPDAPDAVGRGDLDDDLDGGVVVEAAVPADDERHVGDVRARGDERGEGGLDEVVEVVALHEELGLLPQARGPGLLAVDGRRLERRDLERAEPGRRRQVDRRVLVHPRWERLRLVRVVLDRDLPLEDVLRREPHGARDLELGARLERRRRAADQERLQLLDELVLLRVERDLRRGREARGEDRDGVDDDVGVRAQEEEVVALLHRGEPGPGHDDRRRALEALDRRAHRRLELEHLGRRVVLRVHRLLVLDHRQGDDAARGVQEAPQRLEVDPEVVRVEVLVRRDVLELVLVLVRALRRLAQDELRVGLAHGQVAALLVVRRPLAALHHEGRLRVGEVLEELGVERRAEVVRVRDEHVLDALGEEGVQLPRAEQRGVQVAVARRAPLDRRLCRPRRRLQRLDLDLRDLVLDELQVLVRGEHRVLRREEGHRVLRRRERVHQHEPNLRPERRPHPRDLLRRQVQERIGPLDEQQALRVVQPHARPEAAVQLQDHRLPEQRRVRPRRHLLELRHARRRRDLAFGNHSRCPRHQRLVRILERPNRRLVQPFGLHLLRERCEVAHLPPNARLRRLACNTPPRRLG